MKKIKLGYIIASNELMVLNKSVGYFYREKPDSNLDSGWRFFSGYETQEYVDDPNNFSMYNAETIISKYPNVAEFLAEKFPAEFEWSEKNGIFLKV